MMRWIISLGVLVVITLTGGSSVVAPIWAMPAHPLGEKPELSDTSPAENNTYTVDQIYRDIDELASKYPLQVKVQVLGRSYFGDDLRALSIGQGPKVLMVTAGMHGWEWIGSYLVMRDLRNLLEWEHANSFLAEYKIIVLPLVNPDGVRIAQGERLPLVGDYSEAQLASWKANAWGVDINRNFPHGYEAMARFLPVQPGPRMHPGRASASERETQAVILAIESFKPDMLIDLHSSGNLIFWHYNQTQHLKRDREIAHLVAEHLGFGVSNNLDQAIGGHLKDYFVGTYAKPSMIVEIGSYHNRLQIHKEFKSLHERFAHFLFFLCTVMP